MSKLKIAIIISSTRPTRFGELPAKWILEKANARPEIDAEIADVEAGRVEVLDSAGVRDRYQQLAATARDLLADADPDSELADLVAAGSHPSCPRPAR